MSKEEQWLPLLKAAQLVKHIVGCTLGETREILCMAGDDQHGTVRTRGAEGVREWAKIDLEQGFLQDGFGDHRYWDVEFNEADLRVWLRRYRYQLRQEYGQPASERTKAAAPEQRLAYKRRIAEFQKAGRTPPIQTTADGKEQGDREWAASNEVPRSVVEAWRREMLPKKPSRGRPPKFGK